MSEVILRMIAMMVRQVSDNKVKRVDQHVRGETFDKITVYQCGPNVIRIDLHKEKQDEQNNSNISFSCC